MPELNFRKKITDVSKILKSWQHRKLTLLGKVTVIKTLVLPKLIHLFTSLSNLKQSLFNDLNKLFFRIPLISHPYYPCFRCINFQT
jgi:hypothetical protein